jgi:hypothetical protein
MLESMTCSKREKPAWPLRWHLRNQITSQARYEIPVSMARLLAVYSSRFQCVVACSSCDPSNAVGVSKNVNLANVPGDTWNKQV